MNELGTSDHSYKSYHSCFVYTSVIYVYLVSILLINRPFILTVKIQKLYHTLGNSENFITTFFQIKVNYETVNLRISVLIYSSKTSEPILNISVFDSELISKIMNKFTKEILKKKKKKRCLNCYSSKEVEGHQTIFPDRECVCKYYITAHSLIVFLELKHRQWMY